MAANSITKLAVIITGDTSPLRIAVGEAAVALGGMTPQALAGSAALTSLAAAGAAFVKIGLQAKYNIEQLRISFEVMTGSAKTANALIADMRTLSLQTPLDMGDVQKAGRTLMAMGEPVEAIITDLKMLGDVASGTNQPLNELAQVFGQVMQAGRLTGNELRQFNERGVPLMTTLAEQLGVSKAAIRKMVEEGEIGSSMVVKAFEAMTAAGGRFSNMMERQTETTIGQWNKLKESITFFSMDFLEAFSPGKFANIVTTGQPVSQSLFDSFFASTGIESAKDFLKWLNNEYFPAARRLYIGEEGAGGYETSNKAIADAKRQAEDAKKQAEDAAKALAKLQEKGDAMAQSLRTPFEVMRDALAEAMGYMSDGVISLETYGRAVKKIGDDYEKAMGKSKGMKGSPFTAAVERGSAEEYSARLQSKVESDKMLDEARKTREIEQKILEATKSVDETLKKSQPVNLKVGRLT